MAAEGLRSLILRACYRLAPFDLRGDCQVPTVADGVAISCVINFFGRLDLLAGILYSLASQSLSRERFEVVLVEDRGGTPGGLEMAGRFAEAMNVRYFPLDRNFGRMGYARNFALARTRGDIVLFLDDDTVILQETFLERMLEVFATNRETAAVVPFGQASFSFVGDRYAFHDPYFMTSRCTAYRRQVLAELSGFVDEFVGQEDVEYVVRFTLAGKVSKVAPELEYFHPPLTVTNLRKPMAVGYSFFLLKNRYPLFFWILLLLNCARHAPLIILPGRRNREMGRFGFGFLRGVIDGFRGVNEQGYK